MDQKALKYKRNCRMKAIITITVIGLVFVLVGLVLPFAFPAIMESLLIKKLMLRPDSPTLETYKSPPVPIFMQFWFFNVTNPDDILKYGSKPIVQEVGPYTYDEKRVKYDLQWNKERGTLTFQQNKTFFFRPDLSGSRTESDRVTTLNAVFISLASKFSSNSLPPAAEGFLEVWKLRFNLEPFITRTVGELLFYGYDVPLLKQLGELTNDPAHIRGKFGFFYPRNNTSGGKYEVYTGEKGMEQFQRIASWHGKENVNFWATTSCNMINGSDGAQFPRPVKREQPIYFFTAELCRSIYGFYEKDILHGNLRLYRYVLPDELLDRSRQNDCYCASNFTCRAGMIDISSCKKGSPVVISTPHFYQGSVVDVNNVIGLHPEKEMHETHLDIEPNTGVTMKVSKRIQINMPLRHYANLPTFEKAPEIIFPILWLNESAEVPVTRANALHRKLTVPQQIVLYSCWALLAVGILLIVIAVIGCACLLYAEKRSSQSNAQGKQNYSNAAKNYVDGPASHKLLTSTKSNF